METARPRPVHEVLPFTASANFETEQLPVQHASWWWSLPVVNILCTACLVELMWQLLAGVASSYIMNKVITTLLVIVFPNRSKMNAVTVRCCHSLDGKELTGLI